MKNLIIQATSFPFLLSFVYGEIFKPEIHKHATAYVSLLPGAISEF